MNKSAEDYIKTIYILKGKTECLRSIDVARELGFSKASVSTAMANLRKNGIIIMNDDCRIDFTPEGEEIAQDLYDRYATLCGVLTDVVGVDEKTARMDAWRMGHYISDLTYAGIRQYRSFYCNMHPVEKEEQLENWRNS